MPGGRRLELAQREADYLKVWCDAIDAQRSLAEGGWLRDAATRELGPDYGRGVWDEERWGLLCSRVWQSYIPAGAQQALMSAVSDGHGAAGVAEGHARRLSSEMLRRLLAPLAHPS